MSELELVSNAVCLSLLCNSLDSDKIAAPITSDQMRTSVESILTSVFKSPTVPHGLKSSVKTVSATTTLKITKRSKTLRRGSLSSKFLEKFGALTLDITVNDEPVKSEDDFKSSSLENYAVSSRNSSLSALGGTAIERITKKLLLSQATYNVDAQLFYRNTDGMPVSVSEVTAHLLEKWWDRYKTGNINFKTECETTLLYLIQIILGVSWLRMENKFRDSTWNSFWKFFIAASGSICVVLDSYHRKSFKTKSGIYHLLGTHQIELTYSEKNVAKLRISADPQETKAISDDDIVKSIDSKDIVKSLKSWLFQNLKKPNASLPSQVAGSDDEDEKEITNLVTKLGPLELTGSSVLPILRSCEVLRKSSKLVLSRNDSFHSFTVVPIQHTDVKEYFENEIFRKSHKSVSDLSNQMVSIPLINDSVKEDIQSIIANPNSSIHAIVMIGFVDDSWESMKWNSVESVLSSIPQISDISNHCICIPVSASHLKSLSAQVDSSESQTRNVSWNSKSRQIKDSLTSTLGFSMIANNRDSPQYLITCSHGIMNEKEGTSAAAFHPVHKHECASIVFDVSTPTADIALLRHHVPHGNHENNNCCHATNPKDVGFNQLNSLSNFQRVLDALTLYQINSKQYQYPLDERGNGATINVHIDATIASPIIESSQSPGASIVITSITTIKTKEILCPHLKALEFLEDHVCYSILAETDINRIRPGCSGSALYCRGFTVPFGMHRAGAFGWLGYGVPLFSLYEAVVNYAEEKDDERLVSLLNSLHLCACNFQLRRPITLHYAESLANRNKISGTKIVDPKTSTSSCIIV